MDIPPLTAHVPVVGTILRYLIRWHAAALTPAGYLLSCALQQVVLAA